MKGKIILVHGWKETPRSAWYPWLKKELTRRGFEIQIPKMPHPEKPVLQEWIDVLEKLMDGVEDIILIGHSLGCRAILKFTENHSVRGIILVAARVGKSKFKELEQFYEKDVSWKKVKKNCRKIVGIYSDNDPLVPLRDTESLRKKLGASILIEHGKGHLGGDSGVKELPSVVDTVDVCEKAEGF